MTKSELVQVYGVKNAEATLAALEKKLGVAFKDWDAETTEKVRETLEKMKKKNTEEMENIVTNQMTIYRFKERQ